jgi:hypothetical protein
MENTSNANYGLTNRNCQQISRTNAYQNSKLNGNNNQLLQVYFDINDPENFYNNNKNSDPQKSEFTFEAQISNQKRHKNELDHFIYTQSFYTTEDFLEDENDDNLDSLDDDDEFEY